jgi:RHS repeat-associated protein
VIPVSLGCSHCGPPVDEDWRSTGYARSAESLTPRIVAAAFAGSRAFIIDVSRGPYVVQKSKMRQKFFAGVPARPGGRKTIAQRPIAGEQGQEIKPVPAGTKEHLSRVSIIACENRLLDVNDAAHARVASYAYDYLGRRISRTIYGAPNVTIRYAYDGARIIAEYDGSGTLLRKFVYGPGLDEPICLIDVANGNAAYYYHRDGLGSVVALSDVNNVLVERYAYDVFGRPTIRDPNGVTIAASARGNPYLFTGRPHDAESGLYYYRARYYDYATGRFLQPDPTGYGDGLNLYSYCGNNPFNFSDPSGLCKESIFDLLDRVTDVVAPYALPVTLTCLSILSPPVGLGILGFMGGMNIGEAAFTGTDIYGNPLSTSQRLYRGVSAPSRWSWRSLARPQCLLPLQGELPESTVTRWIMSARRTSTPSRGLTERTRLARVCRVCESEMGHQFAGKHRREHCSDRLETTTSPKFLRPSRTKPRLANTRLA